jgi:hypothetical protein
MPGALSARTIKALCQVLHDDHKRRDSGLALLDAFDCIDLADLQTRAAVDAAVRKVGRVKALADRIRSELGRLLPGEQDLPGAGPIIVRQHSAGV